jgi:hypothetical protein
MLQSSAALQAAIAKLKILFPKFFPPVGRGNVRGALNLMAGKAPLL